MNTPRFAPQFVRRAKTRSAAPSRWLAFRSVRTELLGIIDGVSILGALTLALVSAARIDLVEPLLKVLLYGFAWRACMLMCNVYGRGQTARRLVLAVLLSVLFGLGSAVVLPSVGVPISWLTASLITLGTVSSLLLFRLGVQLTTLPERRRVLLVGTGPRALLLYKRLTSDRELREIVGVIDSGEALSAELSPLLLGPLTDFSGILMRTHVDEVLVALPMRSHYDAIADVISACELGGVQVRYPADLFSCGLARSSMESPHDGTPEVTLRMACEDWRIAVKRFIDIVGASIALVLLSPLFLVLAVCVKLSGDGSVFFAQRRFGYRKSIFRMYKFRTMVENAEALQHTIEAQNEKAGPVFKIKNDPRITPLGRFLRRSSLDELPQFWNVLIGDMSLVGPRPLSTRDVSLFDEPWLMRRFSVRPGITGLWQVSGRSNLEFREWMQLDLSYIDQWSLTRDLRIMLRTLPAVLRSSGAM